MKIILLRHGKPAIGTQQRLTAAELAKWIADYNDAALDRAHPPPTAAIQHAAEGAFVVCSTLRRSRESAHLLGVANIDACAAAFRELELPHACWRVVRLPVLTWAVLFRFMWLLGFSANGESVKAARERARYCAEQLAAWAEVHGTVLFVGHGSLNWFIARHLRRMGWSGLNRSPRNYWEFADYCYEAERPTGR